MPEISKHSASARARNARHHRNQFRRPSERDGQSTDFPAIWRDDFEGFGPDRWTEVDPPWAAPELDLGDGRRLVLDAPDPFPEEEWVVAGVN